jgi:hypothetical protein
VLIAVPTLKSLQHFRRDMLYGHTVFEADDVLHRPLYRAGLNKDTVDDRLASIDNGSVNASAFFVIDLVGRNAGVKLECHARGFIDPKRDNRKEAVRLVSREQG